MHYNYTISLSYSRLLSFHLSFSLIVYLSLFCISIFFPFVYDFLIEENLSPSALGYFSYGGRKYRHKTSWWKYLPSCSLHLCFLWQKAKKGQKGLGHFFRGLAQICFHLLQSEKSLFMCNGAQSRQEKNHFFFKSTCDLMFFLGKKQVSLTLSLPPWKQPKWKLNFFPSLQGNLNQKNNYLFFSYFFPYPLSVPSIFCKLFPSLVGIQTIVEVTVQAGSDSKYPSIDTTVDLLLRRFLPSSEFRPQLRSLSRLGQIQNVLLQTRRLNYC